MPGRIFVSYRRDDVAGDAGRLTDHLKRRFGKRRIFLDIDSIDPGTDFVQALDASLKTTAAMLVVIGPRWTSLRDANGTRRLDAPDDFVVREVEAALGRGIPVVPVLMQGAALPTAADLPASIAPLVTRQTAVIDHSEFHDDVVRLCNRLAPMVGGHRWRWWTAAALVAVLAAGFVVYGTLRTAEVDRTSAPDASVGSTRDSPDTLPTAAMPSPLVPVARGTTSTAERPPDARESSPAATAPAAVSPAPGDLRREAEKVVLELQAAERTRQVDSLFAEASAQRGRAQFGGAIATLARAHELAPSSETVRQAQEALTIEWLRNVRFESAQVQRPSAEGFQPVFGQPAYVETVNAALALVDASLTSATGSRRADLLAHSGWANYLLWRQGQASGVWGPPGSPRPDPQPRYREALAIEPENPFANAMLAHHAFRVERDLTGAQRLFATALRTRREVAFVRRLQWVTFGTDGQIREDHELVRVADDMRRHGERLSIAQAGTLYGAYRSVASAVSSDTQGKTLLDVLPAADHIATVRWVFEDYLAARGDESTRQTIDSIVAMLQQKAGRSSALPQNLRE